MELNIKYKTDMIKFLDLQKVTAKYAEEIHEAVLRVVDSYLVFTRQRKCNV